jgi:hypothetical protein
MPTLVNGLPQNPEVSSAGTVEPTELALRVRSGKGFYARSGRWAIGTSGSFRTLRKRNVLALSSKLERKQKPYASNSPSLSLELALFLTCFSLTKAYLDEYPQFLPKGRGEVIRKCNMARL